MIGWGSCAGPRRALRSPSEPAVAFGTGMDLTDPAQRRIFFEVHDGLPREAPGSAASTARALAMVGDGGRLRQVLDVGCGPGMQTLDLADRLAQTPIVAVDLYLGYLQELRRRAVQRGRAARVLAVRADMARLPFAANTFDLIWCEGAAYVVGVEQALRAWRPLLRSGGRIAFTELVWLRDDPPAAVRAHWAGYPGMQNCNGIRAAIDRAGFERLGDFVLPDRDWWDDYYGPLGQRIDLLRRRYSGDETAARVLHGCAAEIELYRRYPGCYGYAFFVAAI